jgi:hypothetical protein
MNTYGGEEVYFRVFLTLKLEEDEWLASRLCRFTHRERAPWDPLHMRQGGPQSRSRHCGEKKNLALSGIEPGTKNP